ncbi:MAG TPA: hypothetical protein VI728_02095 [Syntrophales bacterium]|nr:hypothetical protein [Syntrophales bacterium]
MTHTGNLSSSCQECAMLQQQLAHCREQTKVASDEAARVIARLTQENDEELKLLRAMQERLAILQQQRS